MIIWIEAADFQNAGQWKLDTQFTHLCGSPYLLACHTPGVPVRDAVCRFAAPFEGMARVAGNNLRHRVHTFAPIAAEKVRLTILDSDDHKTTRLFEIRLYNE